MSNSNQDLTEVQKKRSLSEYSFQILDATGCDGLRAFVELEDLDRNVTVITHLLEHSNDWDEVDLSKSQSFEVFVVGMKIREIRPGLSNNLEYRLGFRTHRLNIENDLEIKAREFFDKHNSFGGHVDEIGIRQRQRLEAHDDAPLL